jgi:hypothetical protein
MEKEDPQETNHCWEASWLMVREDLQETSSKYERQWMDAHTTNTFTLPSLFQLQANLCWCHCPRHTPESWTVCVWMPLQVGALAVTDDIQEGLVGGHKDEKWATGCGG